MKKLWVCILMACIQVMCLTSLTLADLSNGLVAYYPFNGNANDESGNGKNALLISGAALTQDQYGKPNKAYYFDGVNDFIELPHPGYLSDGSISFWVNPHRVENQYFISITINYLGGNYDGMGIGQGISPLNSLVFSSWDGVGAHYPQTDNLVPGRWYSISATWGSAGMKLYVDGELKDEDPYKGGIYAGTNYCFIGADTWGYYGYADLDEIRIYNRALSESEIRGLAASVPLPPTLLLLGSCLLGLGTWRMLKNS
jgi:hypothetical protein